MFSCSSWTFLLIFANKAFLKFFCCIFLPFFYSVPVLTVRPLGRGIKEPSGDSEPKKAELSQRLVKDLYFLIDPSWPQLAAPPKPALSSCASEQARRQRLKRGFLQPALKLGFHIDGKKTFSSLFYTTEGLGSHCLEETVQVPRVVEIIQGFLVAKIFPPICWVSTLKTLLILSCIWHRFPEGCGRLCGQHEMSPASQLLFPSSDNAKNIFKEGIPFNMQVVIPKMLQLLILPVAGPWSK